MKIAVINSGSSSIKFKLFLMPEAKVLAHALIERIGEEDSHVVFEEGYNEHVIKDVINTHQDGLKKINALLKEYGIVEHFSSLDAIAHRVVHGGEYFKDAVLIDDNVIRKIEELKILAPLHNPVNLDGIVISRKKAPNVKQIAVFDTAFHSTMPKEAYLYALPYELYEEHKIRRYGFHGISHSFIMKRTAKEMNADIKDINMLSIHLGAGASICAIKEGKSIDTSMGFTPLEGLVMASRSGDIDPAIVLYLQKELGLNIDEIDDLLNKHSGLLGICGDLDIREIQNKDDERDKLALEIMARRVKKYIGSYTAVLGRIDAVTFTAGIGENSAYIRSEILEDLEVLGIEIDKKANDSNSALISNDSSKTKVFVIKTDEELEIAFQSRDLLMRI